MSVKLDDGLWVNKGREGRGTIIWTRVWRASGKDARVSTGTAEPRRANAIRRMVLMARERGDFAMLEAVADGKLKLAEMYEAFRRDPTMAQAKRALDDVDLQPWIGKWKGRSVKGRLTPRYLTQVRDLLGEEPYPRSDWDHGTVNTLLTELDVSDSTRLRYRAAVSAFDAYLVGMKVTERRIMGEVMHFPKNKKPIIHYTPEDEQRLVLAQVEPYRTLAAVMAGTGMEWGAARVLHRDDVRVDERMIHAKGTKTDPRDRWCEVTEDWCWEIILAHIAKLTPHAPLFPRVTPITRGKPDQYLAHYGADQSHKAAVEALDLPVSTMHDHRRTFAVTWLDRADPTRDVAWLRNQLGHDEKSTVIYTTYAVRIRAKRLSDAQKARMAPGMAGPQLVQQEKPKRTRRGA